MYDSPVLQYMYSIALSCSSVQCTFCIARYVSYPHPYTPSKLALFTASSSTLKLSSISLFPNSSLKNCQPTYHILSAGHHLTTVLHQCTVCMVHYCADCLNSHSLHTPRLWLTYYTLYKCGHHNFCVTSVVHQFVIDRSFWPRTRTLPIRNQTTHTTSPQPIAIFPPSGSHSNNRPKSPSSRKPTPTPTPTPWVIPLPSNTAKQTTAKNKTTSRCYITPELSTLTETLRTIVLHTKTPAPLRTPICIIDDTISPPSGIGANEKMKNAPPYYS